LRFADAWTFRYTFTEILHHKIFQFAPKQADDIYILDCGANIGLATLFFAQHYPSAVIDAFEPDPANYALLQANLAPYQRPGLQLHPAAVWTQDTLLTLHQDGAEASSVMARPGDAAQASVQVQARALGPYLNRPVAMLKMDIEGAETAVLQAVQHQLHLVDHLFVEYHSTVGQPQALHILLQLLKDTGFRVVIQTHGLHARQPFLERPAIAGYDLLANIFAFR
jgi:FkbM family methyltransferase